MQEPEQSRPARHTSSSFHDQQAISMVSVWITKTQKAMPDLKVNDKWPNIDGYIELVDEAGYPKGTLKAQVKKLTEDGAKRRQYTFRDDKFLQYCKESVDRIPIVFIGVDCENKRAFWLHINKSYVEGLNGGKTVKFTENQVIDEHSTSFINDWGKLVKSYSTNNEEYEKYKTIYSMLSEFGTPAIGLSEQKYVNIHTFLDAYNNLLDNEFRIVKRRFYPNQWKIGFAYYEYEGNTLSYTLYPIPLNKNDIQIKQINEDLHGILKKHRLDFIKHFIENPIESAPQLYAQEIIQRKLSTLLKHKLLDHANSEFLAREFVFAFIDLFHVQLGLSKKDEYTLSEIKDAFRVYLPLWMEESVKLILRKRRNSYMNIATVEGGELYLDPENLIRAITSEERKEIECKTKERLKDKNVDIPGLPLGNKKLPLGICFEFLTCLENMQQEVLRRPYKLRNYSRVSGGDWIWNWFSKRDVEYNLHVFFEKLQSVYETILETNFPLIKKQLLLFDRVDKIIIVFATKDEYNVYKDHPTYKMFGLRAKDEIEEVAIEVIAKESESAKVFSNFNYEKNLIEHNKKKYNVIYTIESGLDFIYKDTPMLNFIYDLLNDKFGHYFESNMKRIQSWPT